MRNCEPYNEVSKETLNPYYHLQQGTASFDDEEYKKVIIQSDLIRIIVPFAYLKTPLFAIIFCFGNNISVFWIFIFAVSFSPFKFKLV